MTRTFVIVQLQIEGLHKWQKADGDVGFLRDMHRHIFHIKAVKEVQHDDRDIEIVLFKRALIKHLHHNFGDPCNFNCLSCEAIARHLLTTFELDECQVLEDGENGALIRNT